MSQKSLKEKQEHEKFMQIAIYEANKAYQKNEVPIGALIIDLKNGKIIAKAHNQAIKLLDSTAHAEILAIRKASKKVLNYRLLDTAIYVTIEPCVMCMGAIIHARISKVIFGASDKKWGACGSLYDFSRKLALNHKPQIIKNICKEDCLKIIKDFFISKRKNKINK